MEHPGVADRCLWVCTSPTDVTHHVTLKTRRRNLLPHPHPPLFLYQLLHSLSWLVEFNFGACCHELVIKAETQKHTQKEKGFTTAVG